MEWTTEEVWRVRARAEVPDRVALKDEQVMAFMDATADLLAARGGTLEPAVLVEALGFLGGPSPMNGGLPNMARALRAHCASQGSRLAKVEWGYRSISDLMEETVKGAFLTLRGQPLPDQGRLEILSLQAATRALAELRHAYSRKEGWELVARAIRYLEESVTPKPEVKP